MGHAGQTYQLISGEGTGDTQLSTIHGHPPDISCIYFQIIWNDT